MAAIRRTILVVGVAMLLVAVWLWWNSAPKVDMSAYVPADSIIYLEADNLPNIVTGIASTGAWKELAPAGGITSNVGKIGPLSRLAAWTGIGSSDAVVLSRAQVAVTVLGFEAEAEPGETLKISPRAALVAETHTGESRVRAALEKLAGDFARRSFGRDALRTEVSGTPLVIWAARTGTRRKIVTAVSESVAVIGNDEAAVLACLAVRRGESPSLKGNPQLEAMRSRLEAENALAFGFAPAGSAAKIVEIFAPVFVNQVTEKAENQSLLAVLLPELTNKILGDAGWSSRVNEGAIEDRYFLTPAGEGVAQRLGASLVAAAPLERGASEFLPADIYQVSRYTLREPESGWVGLNAAIATQVDVTRAPLVVLALEALLKPYGIEKPREFLRAAGPEIATARLNGSSENKLLVVSVRDRQAMNRQVRNLMGSGARALQVAGEEIFVSTEPEVRAAGFAGDYLIMGDEEDVRACLVARAENRTLQAAGAFKAGNASESAGPPLVTTLTVDKEPARAVISYFAGRSNSRNVDAADGEAFEKALSRYPYSLSETRLAEDGFMKITRSSFGQFGEIIARFAP